ncbi:hypothetical protein MADA3029_1020024 [Vibrio nigripulchritudo MADA3029]|nr:hypothetical protein VIBNIMADA3020_1240002 [Vibrio nigripulchritudo MADA3020]CCN51169.1 hypothetical protein VIBNIMADA3021_100066 [Vibrio nigripulchritudo MADA3021]CCN56857.1 hypothetical protein MADA3029_1020024 [Vibrio nigripulchritudo MADA3029]CCN83439.1 hypothetical protein VIBNIBLFn1_600075 [Vibrio nigripulchritudo BLFn1]CCN88798.1 hypothetical protein VIBNISFn27_480076 [Vibrio nigripulchritudo SFn27]CCO41143.1 hypothetical protein VIBNISFn135_410076 [Vibrio nigripulchritudo SFn135]CC
MPSSFVSNPLLWTCSFVTSIKLNSIVFLKLPLVTGLFSLKTLTVSMTGSDEAKTGFSTKSISLLRNNPRNRIAEIKMNKTGLLIMSIS